MAEYKASTPFHVPVYLLIPSYETIKGVRVKIFPKPTEADIIFGSFKTFGGTDTTKNEVYSVEDTATVETWYRPDIKSDCRVLLADTNNTYEIVGEPENINMRNQYLKFKVRGIKGGA